MQRSIDANAEFYGSMQELSVFMHVLLQRAAGMCTSVVTFDRPPPGKTELAVVDSDCAVGNYISLIDCNWHRVQGLRREGGAPVALQCRHAGHGEVRSYNPEVNTTEATLQYTK